MIDDKVKCPKCGSQMAEGFILDADYPGTGFQPLGPSFFTQARWVEGQPVHSQNSGIKWNDKEAYKITAYRCPNCGLIELHGDEPTKYPESP
jgi:predicted RNA-binding Zn-ribbon protein involved in translation (DUF1610 family)